MGQVISIQEASKVSPRAGAYSFIDRCYDRLAEQPGFVERPGQRDLSYRVCKSLVSDVPLAAEAPTGTGKTLSYLIGALGAAQRLRKLTSVPIVVATATVGLQGQILSGDLPRLVQAGIISQSDAVLAKGRGRYFCIQSAERLTATESSGAQVDFFDDAGNEHALVLEDVQQMLSAWQDRTWTGDFDSYPGPPSAHASKVGASSDTCVGHKCAHYRECPFFSARRALSSAQVVVANHNLVLSDLSMVNDGIDPLFPFGKYLVVFDEAHHLPDKALEVGSAKIEFTALLADLPRLAGFSRAWQKNAEIVKLFAKEKLHGADFEMGGLINALEAAKFELSTQPVDSETYQYRFSAGQLPEPLVAALSAARVCAEALVAAMRDATQALKQSNLAERSPLMGPLTLELLYAAAGVNAVLNATLKALRLLLAPARAVRWLFRLETSVALHVSPLEGADVLKELLWGSERVRVSMVSATLQDFDGFERFQARCGAPAELQTVVLPHIFPYRENKLFLVDMAHSPKQESRRAYEQELLSAMPEFIDAGEGTLVLFPSRALLRLVVPELKRRFPGLVLSQEDMTVKKLVSTHRERIDRGQGSLLCGMATLAEGLDLPGAYCTHVIICTVPFTVPTSPVEQEMREVLGRDYFAKRVLPDALVRITQMVGRLMRRETDRGRITVFDKRMFYSKWGRQILGAIPGFQRKLVSTGTALADMQGHYKLDLHAPSRLRA